MYVCVCGANHSIRMSAEQVLSCKMRLFTDDEAAAVAAAAAAAADAAAAVAAAADDVTAAAAGDVKPPA